MRKNARKKTTQTLRNRYGICERVRNSQNANIIYEKRTAPENNRQGNRRRCKIWIWGVLLYTPTKTRTYDCTHNGTDMARTRTCKQKYNIRYRHKPNPRNRQSKFKTTKNHRTRTIYAIVDKYRLRGRRNKI